MIKQIIKQQLTTYGDNCQLLIYNPPLITYHALPPPRSDTPKKTDLSLSKTRINLYRLIQCNINKHGHYLPTFLTLTYAQNEQNRKKASTDLRLFHMRLSYRLNKKLKYIAVPEFQQRGAIHYHIIYFNLPYTPIDVLHQSWGHGSIQIKALYTIKRIAAYISKYITKDTIDLRHKNSRLLITSRGLIKPQLYTNIDVDIKLSTLHTIQESKTITSNKTIINYVCNNRRKNS